MSKPWSGWAVLGVFAGLAAIPLLALAIAGGVRLTDPLSEMRDVAEDFPLEDGDQITIETSDPDRICFLQCADWRVTATIDLAEAVSCSMMAERTRLWSGLQPYLEDSPTCFIAVDGAAFGESGWLIGLSPEDETGTESTVWNLSLVERA